MNCKNCGNMLAPGEMFCKNCGTPVDNGQPMINNQPVFNNDPVVPNNPMMNNGPMMNNNPMMNGPMPPNPMYNNGPMMNNWQNNPYQQKDNKMLYLVGGLILLAIIALVVVLLVTGKNKENSGSNTKSTPTTVAKATYSKTFQGYKFSIPNEYTAVVDGDDLIIYNEDDYTWKVWLGVVDSNFNQIKTNKEQVKTNMIVSGYTIDKYELKNVDGVEYLVYEASVSGENGLIAFGELDSSHVFGISCVSRDNEFDYSLLNKIAPIVKSAKKSSSANSIEIDNKFKIMDFIK